MQAARRLVKNVFSHAEKLQQFPELGRVPPELKNSAYREIIVKPCRIFYRIHADTVYILYVMRSERQLKQYLLDKRGQNIN